MTALTRLIEALAEREAQRYLTAEAARHKAEAENRTDRPDLHRDRDAA